MSDPDSPFHMRVIAKNIQSLQTQDRENALLEELELNRWEIMCLSETWREERRELWTSRKHHLFAGSGGTQGRNGVAIVLHAQLHAKIDSFCAMSDRVAALDFTARRRKFRVIAVYLPHSGYVDSVVEQFYGQISELVRQGRNQRRTLILGGDWNARVGKQVTGEDNRVLGAFGYGDRNHRGQTLVDWALLNKLAILNTQFQKRPERQWTYSKGNVELQLDYILCEWSKRKHCTNSGTTQEITVGVDHVGVKSDFLFNANAPKPSKRRVCSKIHRVMTKSSKDAFAGRLQDKICELNIFQTISDIDGRISAIEAALVETARETSEAQCTEQVEPEDYEELKTKWIELRSARMQARTEKRHGDAIRISKEINKIMRAITRQREKCRTDKILREFRGLKYLKSIKCNSKKHLIAAMRNSKGEVVTTRVEIANMFADFYEKLYAATGGDVAWQCSEVSSSEAASFQLFTASELERQVRRMANGKSEDEAGVSA